MCLVESAQSMANHLESQGWDDLENQPVPPLDTVPWVRVVDQDGGYLTSSRTEAHRLYSAFLRNSTLDSEPFLDVLRERFGLEQDRPVDIKQLALAHFPARSSQPGSRSVLRRRESGRISHGSPGRSRRLSKPRMFGKPTPGASRPTT